MGKHLQLQRQDSSFHFQSNHQGCLWAILNILDSHRWHAVKNILPHKRNGRLRHPKGNGTSETVPKDHDTVQVPEYFNKEAQILLVERQIKDIVGPNKKLGKSNAKVLTAKETIGKGKTAPAEPSRKKNTKNSSKFKKNAKAAMKSEQYFGKDFENGKREVRQVNRIDKDVSDCLMKEPVDILEMFKSNKKLFAEMLRGEEVGPNRPFRSRNSNTKVGLTKSMSFPVAGASGIRFNRPSKLKHKQNESFPKGKTMRLANPALKNLAYESTQNLHEKSTPDKSDGSPPDLKQQGWNQLVVNRFNAIKQKVKQAFKEKRKGYTRLAVEESSDHLSMAEDGMNDIKSVDETDGMESNNVDGTVHSIKQTSFSSESLERYKHLFAKSFNDNTKYRHSRSLTLASGHKIWKNRLASRSFNRNLSSPDLELFCSFFHDVSHDSSQTDKPIINSRSQVTNSRTETDQNSVITDECKSLDISDAELVNRSLEELDHAEGFALAAGEKRIDEQEELIEDEFTSAILERNHSQDLLPDCKLDDEMEFPKSNQLLVRSPDHLTSSPELPISEGMNCESSIPKDGQMVSNGQPQLSSSDSVKAFSNIVSHGNTAMTHMIFDEQVKGVESNGIENAYYHHVRNIFEVSGLIESELSGTCRSVEFELEECRKEIESELDQQLVFDLVNEALLDINGTSSTYFHKAFSFNCRILPPPFGHQLLEAVWKRIGPYLGSGQELQLGQSLEHVVACDFADRDDGWMKLQLEAEFLALDVEDLIIDELLGELMCS